MPAALPSRNFSSAHSSNVSASIGGSSIMSISEGSRTPNLGSSTPSTHIPNDSAKPNSPSALSNLATAAMAAGKTSAEAFSKANCAKAKFTPAGTACKPSAKSCAAKRRTSSSTYSNFG